MRRPKGNPPPKTRTPRGGTKQATLIAMLRAPDGATIEEIMAATGWQSHTVRGAMARGPEEEARVRSNIGED